MNENQRSSAGVRIDDAFESVKPSDRIERIFGTREFLRLWLAQLVSATGDWLGFLATIALAARLQEGSEGVAIALVLAARVVPGLFLATAVGVLIDRLNRKQVLIYCDIGRACVLVTLPFVDTLGGLIFASFLLELLTMMWQPAKEAIVPNLVPRDRLTSANSLNVAAAYGMFPVAAGIAALLSKAAESISDEGWVTVLRLNEEGLAFYVDALSFLVTALIISTIAIPTRTKAERTAGPRNWNVKNWDLGGALRELREGWQLIAADPIVRAVNVGLATGVMGGGMLVTLGPVFVEQVIEGQEADFNLLLFALGIGMAIGVLTASMTQNRMNRSKVFAGSLMGAGVTLFATASMNNLPLIVPLVVLLGMMAGPVYVLGFTLVHENVENEMRGRIFSALLTLVRLCLLLSLGITSILADLLDRLSQRWWDGDVALGSFEVLVPGARVTMWLAALIILVAGSLATWSLRSGLKPTTSSTTSPTTPETTTSTDDSPSQQ